MTYISEWIFLDIKNSFQKFWQLYNLQIFEAAQR